MIRLVALLLSIGVGTASAALAVWMGNPFGAWTVGLLAGCFVALASVLTMESS